MPLLDRVLSRGQGRSEASADCVETKLAPLDDPFLAFEYEIWNLALLPGYGFLFKRLRKPESSFPENHSGCFE